METANWVTNNPKAAKKLIAADEAYKVARATARGNHLTLEQKLVLIREAKQAREAAYDAALKGGN